MGRRSRGTGFIRSPYAGRQAESNNHGATKKKSVLGCILVLLRSRIYRTRSRNFQLLELRELRKSQAITKDVPPLMDIDPVSVEVGSNDTKSDADPSWAQAPELVEEMRSYAPTLTIPQLFALVFANNPKLVGMANRKPDFHSAATRKSQLGHRTNRRSKGSLRKAPDDGGRDGAARRYNHGESLRQTGRKRFTASAVRKQTCGAGAGGTLVIQFAANRRHGAPQRNPALGRN